MERAAEAARYVTHPVPIDEEALEVTVILDDNDFPVAYHTPNNYIDVEVVVQDTISSSGGRDVNAPSLLHYYSE